jgi:hypothetical protein
MATTGLADRDVVRDRDGVDDWADVRGFDEVREREAARRGSVGMERMRETATVTGGGSVNQSTG